MFDILKRRGYLISDKLDRRILQTRNKIIEAFYILLTEKSFSKITVGEIAETANINRGTFYLHYLDKYDLLEKCQREVFKKIKEFTKDEKFRKEIKNEILYGQPPQIVIDLLEYFQGNAYLIRAILGPNGDPAFEERLRRVMADTFFNNAIDLLDVSQLSIPIELLSEYISSAYVGVIRYWLNTDMKQSPNEIANILFDIALKGPIKASGIIND